MTDSTRDWADEACDYMSGRYGCIHDTVTMPDYLRALVANREAFARMQGRAQGMREAAEISDYWSKNWKLGETKRVRFDRRDMNGIISASAKGISEDIRTRADAIERGE